MFFSKNALNFYLKQQKLQTMTDEKLHFRQTINSFPDNKYVVFVNFGHPSERKDKFSVK